MLLDSSLLTSPTVTIWVLILLVAFTARRYQRNALLPPGPRGNPIIGNAHSMPERHAWLYYTELRRKYGLFQLSSRVRSFGVVFYLSAHT